MSKESGLSLLEMLIVMALTAVFLVNAAYFIPHFCYRFFYLYKTQQIKQVVSQTMKPLMKDIRRAGFIFGQKKSEAVPAIIINDRRDCIILSYDSIKTERWQCGDAGEGNTRRLIYRFHQNNVEVASGVASDDLQRWYKLFDPKEIMIMAFNILDYDRYAKVVVTARLIKNSNISYTFVQPVKYENH